MTDGNTGAEQTLHLFLEFANQGLNNLIYNRDRKKKRERGEEDYQMLMKYIVLFFPVVCVLVALYL